MANKTTTKTDTLTWTLTDGCLTLTGEGPMVDYTADSPPAWAAVAQQIRQVRVENGITCVGGRAFAHCRALESVWLAPSVRRVRWHAFDGCTSLKELHTAAVPTHWRLNQTEQTLSLGQGAFSGTPWQAAQGREFLIHQGQLLEYLADDPHPVIPEGVTAIAPMAFEGKAITGLTLPESVREVGQGAFCRCALTQLTLPKGLETVGAHAFAGNPALERVWVKNPKTQIAPTAFDGTAVDLSVCQGPTGWLSGYGINTPQDPAMGEFRPMEPGPSQLRRLGTQKRNLRSMLRELLSRGLTVTRLWLDREENRVLQAEAIVYHSRHGRFLQFLIPQGKLYRPRRLGLDSRELNRLSLSGLAAPGDYVWYAAPASQDPAQTLQRLVERWLAANPGYRLADSTDRTFLPLTPGRWNGTTLDQYLRTGGVLLAVEPDGQSLTCSVSSYTYNYRMTLYEYHPAHFLAENGPCGVRKAHAPTHAQWRSRYAQPDTYLCIQHEDYYPCEYSSPEDLLDDLLRWARAGGTELYLSRDLENFYGPLELELAELWLDAHPTYHIGPFTADD